jgi:hypothetical protein
LYGFAIQFAGRIGAGRNGIEQLMHSRAQANNKMNVVYVPYAFRQAAKSDGASGSDRAASRSSGSNSK